MMLREKIHAKQLKKYGIPMTDGWEMAAYWQCR
jgi:hypothetical protein